MVPRVPLRSTPSHMQPPPFFLLRHDNARAEDFSTARAVSKQVSATIRPTWSSISLRSRSRCCLVAHRPNASTGLAHTTPRLDMRIRRRTPAHRRIARLRYTHRRKFTFTRSATAIPQFRLLTGWALRILHIARLVRKVPLRGCDRRGRGTRYSSPLVCRRGRRA